MEYCDENLPLSAEQVRGLPFYDTTLQALKWQRDAYLVGPQYADQRRGEREAEANERSLWRRLTWRDVGDGDGDNDDNGTGPSVPMNSVEKPSPGSFNIANRPRFFLRRRNAVSWPPRMPYDATALGSEQIAQIGASFLPSDTVRLALLPIVVQLPTHTLYGPIVQSVVASGVPLAQDPVNQAIRSSLMWFLKDPEMRRMIKEQTRNLIDDQAPYQEGGDPHQQPHQQEHQRQQPHQQPQHQQKQHGPYRRRIMRRAFDHERPAVDVETDGENERSDGT